MEKIFNWISVLCGTIGGFLVSLLGGWDKLIMALLILMVLDYFTGIIKAYYNKELSSQIGFKRIGKESSFISNSSSSCSSREYARNTCYKRNSNNVLCSK